MNIPKQELWNEECEQELWNEECEQDLWNEECEQELFFSPSKAPALEGLKSVQFVLYLFSFLLPKLQLWKV